MAICAKSFEEELDLVEEASETELGEVTLVKYILPLVEVVADKYVKEGIEKESLVNEGFESFSFALQRYLEHANEMEAGLIDPYKFSTYFTWFIRQNIVTYIERNNSIE